MIVQKNSFPIKPLKGVKKKINKKNSSLENWTTKKWALDQVCIMTGTVVMIVQKNFLQ